MPNDTFYYRTVGTFYARTCPRARLEVTEFRVSTFVRRQRVHIGSTPSSCGRRGAIRVFGGPELLVRGQNVSPPVPFVFVAF